MPVDFGFFSFDWSVLWWGIVILLFCLSYLGLVVPGIPDAPLMMAGFLVYHFLIDSEPLGWWFWLLMIGLVLAMMSLDWLSAGFAAKKLGGSKGTLVAAPLGIIFFFWMPFGVLLGPFITVFALEIYYKKPVQTAAKVAAGTVVGFISNIVVKLILLTLAKAWFFYLVA
ncbi:hypothetical protein SAMN05444392_104123 [Seinonella peptonophila]|uniref:DUF456 domain-containing protein n=1 Tax=Seinonella peptonophila TaxID=112248 RepID=A0A1M4X520_9BACL|nr:DUF456 domain-containing protein [Seinonella peptonophila]SHE88473.1 hypothetical protein SAMN05444392_104123 [Seinonella peptonophila]